MPRPLASERTDQSPTLDNLRKLAQEYHDALKLAEKKRREIGKEIVAVKPWYAYHEMQSVTGLSDTVLCKLARDHGMG